MVFVPWPISVDAVRIWNIPFAKPSTATVPLSFFSPLPVKPEPWNTRERPRPRRTDGRSDGLTAGAALRTASSTRSLPTLSVSSCPVAVVQHPLAPQVDARYSQPFGDVLDHQLRREQRLRRTEAAERSVRRSIGSNRAGTDAHVGTGVGAGGVDGGAGQHHRRQCAVGAAIEDDVDVLRQ